MGRRTAAARVIRPCGRRDLVLAGKPLGNRSLDRDRSSTRLCQALGQQLPHPLLFSDADEADLLFASIVEEETLLGLKPPVQRTGIRIRSSSFIRRAR